MRGGICLQREDDLGLAKDSVVAGGLIRRLTGTTLNYGIGRVLPQVIAFALIPVYTAYLRPEDYGIVELALTLGRMVAVLMRLGILGAVTRYYFDQTNINDLRDYVTTTYRVLMANGIFVGLLATVVLPLGPSQRSLDRRIGGHSKYKSSIWIFSRVSNIGEPWRMLTSRWYLPRTREPTGKLQEQNMQIKVWTNCHLQEPRVRLRELFHIRFRSEPGCSNPEGFGPTGSR